MTYLAGFVSPEAFKLAVFDESKGSMVCYSSYQFITNFSLKNTLYSFLEAYSRNDSYSKINHTVIAGSNSTDKSILEVSHIAVNTKLTVKEISEIMEENNHSPTVHLLNEFESLAYGILFFDKNGFPKSEFETINGSIKDLLQGFKEEKDKIIKEEQDNIKEDDDKITPKKYLWKTAKKSLVIGLDKGLKIATVPYGVERDGMPYITTSARVHYTFEL